MHVHLYIHGSVPSEDLRTRLIDTIIGGESGTAIYSHTKTELARALPLQS